MSEEYSIIDRVFIRKEDREIYQRIRTENGALNGVKNVDLFLMAMVLGFEEKGRDGFNEKTPKLSDGLIRTASFSSDHWNLIKSFAVYITEDINVLLDINKMLDIAQRYAYFGITILDDLYFNDQYNFLDIMEELMLNKYNHEEIGV